VTFFFVSFWLSDQSGKPGFSLFLPFVPFFVGQLYNFSFSSSPANWIVDFPPPDLPYTNRIAPILPESSAPGPTSFLFVVPFSVFVRDKKKTPALPSGVVRPESFIYPS